MVRGIWVMMLALAASPGLAQSPDTAMFPAGDSCYLRVYSQDHLAGHPAQRVNQIAIGPFREDSSPDTLALRIAVVLRDQSALYEGVAYCTGAKGALDCGVEGDGGGFRLQLQGADLRLSVGNAGIGLEGPSSYVTLSGTNGDDREFVLYPSDPGNCP